MIDIAERFDLGERIGGGAVADVYRASDHELDRDVVLRLLKSEVAADEEYVERFLREAEAASDIQHPNVVAVLDHGIIADRPFLVRELVEGTTLEDLIERRGALPEHEARALAEQIARGLDAAHARGVLHRDLNAGNVFVTPEGTAKVVDFGMPTAPRHPAPEQVAGEPLDERADVYGLGAVLYQMLTGHSPRGRVVSPRRLGVRVTKQLEQIAARALEAEPARRFATAAAMADALHALVRRVPVVELAPVAVRPPVAVAPAVVVAPRPRLVPRAPPTERIVRPKKVTAARRRRASALPFVLIGLPLVLAFLVGALMLERRPAPSTAVLSATTTPQVAAVVPTLGPVPTLLPPVETTPQPSAAPTVEPAPEPTPLPVTIPTTAPNAPPVALAPTPQPPAAAVPATQSAATATVRSFYELIDQKRFDEAAALWSPRMQVNYPPSTNIYGRFDRTRQIVIRSLAPLAEGASTATVAIDILEVLDSGVTRRWVGEWHLVRDGSRWLMDAPNLRAG